jgi:hypothetical protein
MLHEISFTEQNLLLGRSFWTTADKTNAIKNIMSQAFIPKRASSTKITYFHKLTSVKFYIKLNARYFYLNTPFGVTPAITFWQLNKFAIDTDAKLIIVNDWMAFKYE